MTYFVLDIRFILQVLAGNIYGVFSEESQTVQVKTYENPGPIVLVNSTHDTLTVSWTPPPDNSTHMHKFYYGKVGQISLCLATSPVNSKSENIHKLLGNMSVLK